MKIILATNNRNKVIEFKNKLKSYDIRYDVFTLEDVGFNGDIEEYGVTFEQNSLIKAQVIANLFPKDIVIADDSGLKVTSLNNEPGVYSARYASESNDYLVDKDMANNKKLLSNLKNKIDKSAKFVTVLCIIKPKEEPVFVKGEVTGYIIDKPRGDNGFGYDPLFTNDGVKTFAELTNEEKNELSHRSIAIDKIFKGELLK